MSSIRRKFHVRHPVVVDIGCGCRRPKILSFFSFSSSSSKQRRPLSNSMYPNVFSPSTASLSTTTTTTAAANTSSSFSPSDVTSSPSQAFFSPKQSPKQRRRRKEKKAVVEESVAVEKESSDPYLDFRDSMLQMIVEKEIYNWDDLRELLQLFLSLNSPYHHHLIFRAFAEIWNEVLSPGR